MIEAIIHYIQLRGFQVDVHPGVLSAWKDYGGVVWGFDLTIAPIDLRETYQFDYWRDIVDRYIYEIEENRA